LIQPVSVGKPDARFGTYLLEQFGGATGELTAALQYWVQSFHVEDAGIRDMLQDIAVEEFGHLEMVGKLIAQHTSKMDQTGVYDAPLFRIKGGGPHFLDSQGSCWTAAYINEGGNVVRDLRANIASEAGARQTYEALIKACDDAGTKKALHHLLILVRKDGTGGIQQPSTYRQHPERGSQNLELGRREDRDVVCAAEQLDVRMAPDHAAGGARRVEQNSVERTSVPEGGGLANIRHHQPGSSIQAFQVFVYPCDARGIYIDRHELGQVRSVLQQMSRLSARGCAGIQYPHPWLRRQQRSRELRSGVLNRNPPLAKARQSGERDGLIEPHGSGRPLDRPRNNPNSSQFG